MQRHVLSGGQLLHQQQAVPKWICQSFQSSLPSEIITSCLATIVRNSLPAHRPIQSCKITSFLHVPSFRISQKESSIFVKTHSRGHQSAHSRYARYSTLSSNVSTKAVEPTTPSPSRLSAIKSRLSTRIKRPWTQKDDEILFDLRQQRTQWRIISAKLNRTIAACFARYYRYLDPFLSDAIEDKQAAEDYDGADIKEKILSGTLVEPSVRPQPYKERGPWTGKDRKKLEVMAKANISWNAISHELKRNQDSCKEKWYRIQKSRIKQRQHSKMIRKKQWNRLYKEGFTAYHRDQLIQAVEKHLVTKIPSTIYDKYPLGILGVKDIDTQDEEEEPFNQMMANQSSFIHNQESDNVNSSIVTARLSSETIDWEVISQALNNKFSPVRLRSIYYELAAAKLIWTPEEDEELVHAVIRLGPPELQPKIWTMIKDSFGDNIRSSDDYRARWRELDMPPLEREWDLSEKKKFWTRWLEYQETGSLLHSDNSIGPHTELRPMLLKSSQETLTQSRMDAWDLIAEGLEYRHGRDCEIYFDNTTRNFPKDPELFRYLTFELAKAYVEPNKVTWSPEASRLLVATVNSYIQANKVIKWEAVAQAMDYQYTAKQCETKWLYWSQNNGIAPGVTKSIINDAKEEKKVVSDDEEPPETCVLVEPKNQYPVKVKSERRLWTDKELELLKKGVEEYGHQWTKIRNIYLSHRSTQTIYERFQRLQAKKTGRFSEKERAQLETAIEMFGEDASWELIAGQVPGRTASQCRMNWKYSRTLHMNKLGEPWTEQDRKRLREAVARFGKRWTLVSEFVVGKTSVQCRNEWREKVDPAVNRSLWSSQERDRLMELVITTLNQQDAEEERKAKEIDSRARAPDQDEDQRHHEFIDPAPRYKGKRRIDWNEISKEFQGRTAQQCRLQFAVHRATYRLKGDY